MARRSTGSGKGTESSSIVYADSLLRYDFGAAHPLKSTRVKLTFELMNGIGLLSQPNMTVNEPRQAKRSELLLFHDEYYLSMVEGVSKNGSGYLDIGDTPAFKGCYEASALVAGASLEAVDLIMSGKVTHAFNFAGGLHHAHKDAASGFCIFNDPALSIAYLKEKYHVKRILYLDVDAHHGDGVMYGFYADPSVLDIDFHQDGQTLFPGTGFTDEIGKGDGAGLKINVPLLPFTGDEIFLRLFMEIVPLAVKGYRPEVILLQSGADSHTGDPLTRLNYTTEAYAKMAKTLHGLAQEVAGGRLLVFGGGGYNVANVPRVWTTVASSIANFQMPEATPPGWQRLFAELTGESAPETMKSRLEDGDRTTPVLTERADRILRELKAGIPLLSQ